ncbi:MAG: DNA-3-methyladenine glycosylase I [Candidatus Bathyarchaeia archaeon]|jgi:DNA-3-methyladenine glycosylase I
MSIQETQAPSTPQWWYRNSRPSSDDCYFENMCRIIFQTGLNWRVEKKWSTINPAFCGFNVNKIAAFTEDDVNRLLNDKGVIRNKYKIHAIIENAKKFQQIIRQYGSFRAFLDSLDKSNNYQNILKKLEDTFDRVGPTTAALFLYSVGEKIEHQQMY